MITISTTYFSELKCVYIAVSILLTQLASDTLPNFVKGARINFFGEGELW